MAKSTRRSQSSADASAVEHSDAKGILEALDRSQARIEFSLDGTILNANENFQRAMGYSLEEIQGRHHSMFVDETTKSSIEYREFWAQLNRGIFSVGQYKRFAKGGREIWLQATYNPVLDKNGKAHQSCKIGC
jgi:methyl-accepting chemotaxis protein